MPGNPDSGGYKSFSRTIQLTSAPPCSQYPTPSKSEWKKKSVFPSRGTGHSWWREADEELSKKEWGKQILQTGQMLETS